MFTLTKVGTFTKVKFIKKYHPDTSPNGLSIRAGSVQKYAGGQVTNKIRKIGCYFLLFILNIFEGQKYCSTDLEYKSWIWIQ